MKIIFNDPNNVGALYEPIFDLKIIDGDWKAYRGLRMIAVKVSRYGYNQLNYDEIYFFNKKTLRDHVHECRLELDETVDYYLNT